jgi:hypothetical protein
MRKELLWAGIIGISFGLVIGFGAWRVRSSMTSKVGPEPTPTPRGSVSQFMITLDKPQNLDVVTSSSIGVSGITKPLVLVVVSTEKGDYLTKSLADGTFSRDVDLTSGINHIKVSSVNSDGAIATQEITAVYSASFHTSEDLQKTATDTAQIVAQKIAQAGKLPKSYIGTVTDIADSTIQIKTTDSQIQQIETDGTNVAVVNVKGTNNKAVKLTDIAIGDFIVAMGYVDGNDVLDAQRILIADPSVKAEISISLEKVSTVAKKSLTLTSENGGETSTVTPDKNTAIESFLDGKTKTIKITDIVSSDRLVVVSDTTGTPAFTRTLFHLEEGE